MDVAVAMSNNGNGQGSGNAGGNRGGNGSGSGGAKSGQGGGGENANRGGGPDHASSKGNSRDARNTPRNGKVRIERPTDLLKIFSGHERESRPTRNAIRPQPVRLEPSAPESSIKPVLRPGSENGNNWKTRLDDGQLQTPPSHLKSWNSAKRSPRALQNMVDKYEASGRAANGAGGMIAAFVVAHDDFARAAEPVAGLTGALQDAIDAGSTSLDSAQAVLDGTLSRSSLANDVETLNSDLAQEAVPDDTGVPAEETEVTYDPTSGVVTCTGPACDDPRVADATDRAAALSASDAYFAQINDGKPVDEQSDLGTLVGDLATAGDALDQVTGFDEGMLADIRDLLDDVFENVRPPEELTGLQPRLVE
jgi:hypothetical protein